jgi:uncharacterized protein with von Willebrand factor type A (vWA) domain
VVAFWKKSSQLKVETLGFPPMAENDLHVHSCFSICGNLLKRSEKIRKVASIATYGNPTNRTGGGNMRK